MSRALEILDRLGWLLAIAFIVIAFAITYGQYKAVHDAQETHYRAGVAERHEILDLLRSEHENR